MGLMGEREIFLKPGSLWCFPPNLNHWVEHGPEPKHHLLWVGFDLRAVENRHPEWKALESLKSTLSLVGSPHLERHFLQIIREDTTSSVHQAAGLRLALDALVLEVVRAMENSKTGTLPGRSAPGAFESTGNS